MQDAPRRLALNVAAPRISQQSPKSVGPEHHTDGRTVQVCQIKSSARRLCLNQVGPSHDVKEALGLMWNEGICVVAHTKINNSSTNTIGDTIAPFDSRILAA